MIDNYDEQTTKDSYHYQLKNFYEFNKIKEGDFMYGEDEDIMNEDYKDTYVALSVEKLDFGYLIEDDMTCDRFAVSTKKSMISKITKILEKLD